ncbi:MAG: ATP-binding protein [Bacteroidota bacterium]
MKDLQFEYGQTLLKSQLEIQEQTLRHISREIHDNIGQVLSLVSLNLNTVVVTDQDKLKFTSGLVTKAIDDLRGLSKSLNPDRVQMIGITESIKTELDQLERTGIFHTTLNAERDLREISPEKTIILYRMIQEVLNNIIKHSRAAKVIIRFHGDDNTDLISITDDGCGFDLTHNSPGIGLQNLRQRAIMINAELTITSKINEGTTVSFSLKS